MHGQNPRAETHAQYIAALPEPRRSEIARMDAFIRRHVPRSWKRFIEKGIMAYGSYHYRYPSGREGDWIRVGLASNKQSISLYVCATDARGYIAERYRKRLPKASIGKSCVRYKRFDDLDPKALADLLSEAATAKYGTEV